MLHRPEVLRKRKSKTMTFTALILIRKLRTLEATWIVKFSQMWMIITEGILKMIVFLTCKKKLISTITMNISVTQDGVIIHLT